MTSSCRKASSRQTSRVGSASRRGRGGRGAFTLTEMLIIIAIILTLMALLLPAIGRAWRNGVRARMAADIQAIGVGLEAYKQDHGDYPRVIPSSDRNLGYGALTLCRALIAPGPEISAAGAILPNLGDGAEGPGFRTTPPVISGTSRIPQGRVWGPYLNPDKFTVVGCEILDRSKKRPILYYYGNPKANINAIQGFVARAPYPLNSSSGMDTSGAKPLYNVNDNSGLDERTLQVLMGDANQNQKIDPGETPAYTGPYLLWSAGPDEIYGPPKPSEPVSSKNRCDDVANFPRTEY